MHILSAAVLTKLVICIVTIAFPTLQKLVGHTRANFDSAFNFGRFINRGLSIYNTSLSGVFRARFKRDFASFDGVSPFGHTILASNLILIYSGLSSMAYLFFSEQLLQGLHLQPDHTIPVLDLIYF